MESYLWVMLGSALGGVGRYWCAVLAVRHLGETFPWGTLGVNVLGSFVIGFAHVVAAPGEARHFVMAGLCGGFTTFSAFSLQTLNLLRDGESLKAGASIGVSVVACLVSTWLGQVAALGLGRGWL